MATRSRVLAAMALFTLTLAAFFTGRSVEERALATKIRADQRPVTAPSSTLNPGPTSYRQLAVLDILKLPFAEFYEALRSAPGEARKKWAGELETMPDGSRRVAAVAAFYKLLVQFDPVMASRTISEIKDSRLQNLALGCAVDAAPGFAMQTMAELCVSLNGRPSSKVWDVLGAWVEIDPPAVARFTDEHPGPDWQQSLVYPDLITNLASLDPQTAREWMEQRKLSAVPEFRRSFIQGWYENNRPAAVSYVLAHVDDPAMKDSVGDMLRGLYLDSNDDARKFIENLPDDKKRHEAFVDAFKNLIISEEEDAGEPKVTPRAVGDWVTEFPPEYWKGTLTSVFEWSRKRPDSILAWIEERPLAIRQQVAAEYTSPYGMKAPEALGLVLRIVDPTLRDQLLRAMLNNGGSGVAETRAAVTTASISSEQKNHLLQIIAAIEAEQDQDRATE